MAIEAFQAINFKDYSRVNSSKSITNTQAIQKTATPQTTSTQSFDPVTINDQSQAKRNQKDLIGVFIDFYA